MYYVQIVRRLNSKCLNSAGSHETWIDACMYFVLRTLIFETDTIVTWLNKLSQEL